MLVYTIELWGDSRESRYVAVSQNFNQVSIPHLLLFASAGLETLGSGYYHKMADVGDAANNKTAVIMLVVNHKILGGQTQNTAVLQRLQFLL